MAQKKNKKDYWRRGYILTVYGPEGNRLEERKFFLKKDASRYLRISYPHLKNREVTKYYNTKPGVSEGAYRIKKTALYVRSKK